MREPFAIAAEQGSNFMGCHDTGFVHIKFVASVYCTATCRYGVLETLAIIADQCLGPVWRYSTNVHTFELTQIQVHNSGVAQSDGLRI